MSLGPFLTSKNHVLVKGWATFLVGGPCVGRRSFSWARLLDGSSSIFSTTTIVRVALIGRAKKNLHVFRCPVFHRKKAKKRSTRPQNLRCSVFHPKY